MTFAEWATAASDVIFDTLGEAATYETLELAAFPIKILRPSPDTDISGFAGSNLRTEGEILDVRKSQVPNPEEGDLVTTTQGEFRIRSFKPADTTGLTWRFDCIPVE